MHERSTRIWHLQVWQADDLVVTQAESEAILDAIAGADKSGAARALQQHRASLRRRIVRGRRGVDAMDRQREGASATQKSAT